MTKKSSKSLTERGLSALFWNYLGILAKIFSQLVVGIILARILGPDPFGVYAAILIVTGLGSILVDMGMGPAVIQKKELTEPEIRWVYTRTTMLGIVAASLLMLFREQISVLLRDERIDDVLFGGAIYLVFFAFGVVSRALLARRLHMRLIQINNITSYLLGYLCVGVTMAVLGYGVWSLIFALVVQSLVSTALCYASIRHSLIPAFLVDANQIKSFSLQVLFTNISNWLIENIDNLVVARAFGLRDLGLYSVSYNLVRTPTNHLITTIQGVLFPIASKSQEEHQLGSLQKVYLGLLGIVLFLVAPTFAGLASVSDTVVAALYGSKWEGAGDVLAPLALSMVAHSALVCSVILWGKGRVGLELKVQLSIACLLLGALALASNVSLKAVAWAVCGVYYVRAYWLNAIVVEVLEVRASAVFMTLRGALVVAVFSYIVLGAVDRYLALGSMGASKRLPLLIIVGLLLLYGSVSLLRRFMFSQEMLWLLKLIISRVPGRLRGIVERLIPIQDRRNS